MAEMKSPWQEKNFPSEPAPATRSTMKPLSPAMRCAIELARGNLRKRLVRRHFAPPWYSQGNLGVVLDRTIQALVDRGLAEYTRWESISQKVGRPVEVTLTAKAEDI